VTSRARCWTPATAQLGSALPRDLARQVLDTGSGTGANLRLSVPSSQSQALWAVPDPR